MKNDSHSITQAPLGEVIQNLAVAIARAQLELDRTGLEIAKIMGSADQGIQLGDRNYSLLELGFTPTFYHFTKTAIEARLAFSTSESTEFGISGGASINYKVFAAHIEASYSSKYQFESSGSSSITTNLVSVPAPKQLTDQLAADKT
ncbi:MAG: hypothetical protein QNK37_27765 [Acidobacteriota bacterium]|nr:hypothetical protein [Acidobacteriota bacterium]